MIRTQISEVVSSADRHCPYFLLHVYRQPAWRHWRSQAYHLWERSTWRALRLMEKPLWAAHQRHCDDVCCQYIPLTARQDLRAFDLQQSGITNTLDLEVSNEDAQWLGWNVPLDE